MSASAHRPAIEVRLAGGASSGLASIVEQYLSQQLAESDARRLRAARIRGRLKVTSRLRKILLPLRVHQLMKLSVKQAPRARL